MLVKHVHHVEILDLEYSLETTLIRFMRESFFFIPFILLVDCRIIAILNSNCVCARTRLQLWGKSDQFLLEPLAYAKEICFARSRCEITG